VYVEFVLHTLTLLGNVDDRCSDVTSTADDAFVVEAGVGKQEIDLEGIVLDEVAELLCEARRQPLMKSANLKRFIGSGVVAAPDPSECSALMWRGRTQIISTHKAG
jgi:hypothetical protein